MRGYDRNFFKKAFIQFHTHFSSLRLSHINIIAYKDLFLTKKQIILVMEYAHVEWFDFLLQERVIGEFEVKGNYIIPFLLVQTTEKECLVFEHCK